MRHAPSLTTDDLDFVLPPELIAQHPAPERGASRLMVLDARDIDACRIGRFDELVLDQLGPGDLIVANDARVLHARVPVQRRTGGRGELLLLAPAEDQSSASAGACTWSCMARPARKYVEGGEVTSLHGDAPIRMIERTGAQTWLVELPCSLDDVPAWLQVHGELPLPPYVTERGQDETRYQTVHARVDGSVAAPTAGLHFDDATWAKIRADHEVAFLTLHVGAGTFLPVADGSLSEHEMHHERYEVPSRTDRLIRCAMDEGRRIVAIGTTTTRVLEHVYRDAAQPLQGSTDLFITPGHQWQCVGAMLTNFHLPKSTLIALVMSMYGIEATRSAYAQAIGAGMRFYSFGDAMFIHGNPVPRRRP